MPAVLQRQFVGKTTAASCLKPSQPLWDDIGAIPAGSISPQESLRHIVRRFGNLDRKNERQEMMCGLACNIPHVPPASDGWKILVETLNGRRAPVCRYLAGSQFARSVGAGKVPCVSVTEGLQRGH